jgi:hypothetical protein
LDARRAKAVGVLADPAFARELLDVAQYLATHHDTTHAGWKVRALDDHALEWTTRHGYKFRVDHTGTHPITDDEQL